MKISIIGSGSSGNMILLHNSNEALVLDCGMPYKDCMRTLEYNISKLVGVCVTHCHADHMKYAKDFEKNGIPVFKPFEKFEKPKKYGNFQVYPFEVKHNVPCYGFYILHPDFGKLIYATDTCYIKYKFRNVNHILVECNYSKELVDIDAFKYQHELEDHMEQNTCMEFLKANTSDYLQTVILCHLSQNAIDSTDAVSKAKSILPSDVYVDYARKGLEFEITDKNICPF